MGEVPRRALRQPRDDNRSVSWTRGGASLRGLAKSVVKRFAGDATYSVRKAFIGLTRMARRAGKKHARSAAAPSIKLEPASASGSLGLT